MHTIGPIYRIRRYMVGCNGWLHTAWLQGSSAEEVSMDMIFVGVLIYFFSWKMFVAAAP